LILFLVDRRFFRVKTISARFTSQQIDWLEKESKRSGKSKGAIIIEALKAARDGEGSKIKKSFKVPRCQ
jgi:hypothetical protein